VQKRAPLIALLVLILAQLACGSGSPEATPSLEPTAEASTAPESTESEEPPDTPPSATTVPTDTPVPTSTPTPVPTNTPEPTEPSYSDPVEVVTVEKTGETVTDNYEFPECFKAIFDWHVDAGSYGSASLILNLHSVATEEERTLVNEFGQTAEGLDGRSLQPVGSGDYFFSSENTDEPWQVTFVCEDNVAPVASGELDIEGSGNTVSANYELPECTKSVFSYSVQPNDMGSASLILYLCSVARENCMSIANKFEMDLADPLEGRTVESLRGGLYFLATENATGNDWHITWECQD
jgi:hypothetical protein